MSNRIAQYWVSVDMLLAASSPAAQQEGARLAQCPFTAQHPLEVFLDRKYLKAVVGVSLRQMERHLDELTSPEARLQLQAELTRRRALLDWLDEGSQTVVYMNLFPAAEFPVPTTPSPTSDDEPRW